MIIAAIDTTSGVGSIAILRDRELIYQASLQSPDGFAHVIFGALDEALSSSGLALSAVDCFAAASGPGSFTGVRVGLSAAKGLAEAQRKPVCAVSNLRALAYFGNANRRAALLDARRHQVYAGIYDSDLNSIVPEQVIELGAWLRQVERPDEFVVPHDFPFVDELKAIGNPVVVPAQPLAVAIANCAALQKEPWLDPAAADANYVRRSDAELFWTEPK